MPASPETLALLTARRSAPAPLLAEPGPDEGELDRLLALAARVPDHGKLAPWRFIVFSGDARSLAGEAFAAALAAADPQADGKRLDAERRRFAAPAVVAVVSRAAPHGKVPEWEQVLSAGAVCMNLTVAAAAMGFSTAWLTDWVAYSRDALRRIGVGDGEKVAGFIHIGTAPGPREDRVRPVLAELVTHFAG